MALLMMQITYPFCNLKNENEKENEKSSINIGHLQIAWRLELWLTEKPNKHNVWFSYTILINRLVTEK